MAEAKPGMHWACYYHRITGERVGPATLRVCYGIAFDCARGHRGRARRVRAAAMIRARYRVGR